MVAFNGNLFAFGGADSTGALSTVERYEADRNVWTNVTRMSTARDSPAATVLGSRIYVCGGANVDQYRNITYFRSCERYDPSQDQWQKVANMKKGRGGHCLVTVHGRLYALGGLPRSQWKSVERYDPIEDKWTPLDAPLKRPRDYSSAVVLPGTHTVSP